MPDLEAENVPETGEDRGVLVWVSHPARERPLATMLLLGVILLAGMAAALAMENLWWGLIGVALLVLSMWTYLTPCRFTMNEEGVAKKSVFATETKTWSQVRSLVTDRYGVLLSPFPQPTRLAKFRGLSVQFSGNRKEVLEYIRAHAAGLR
jgi:hypothetical protein